jgi:hypothetical protein
VEIDGVAVTIQRCIPSKTEWGDFDADEHNRSKIYISNLDVRVDKPLLRSEFGQV